MNVQELRIGNYVKIDGKIFQLNRKRFEYLVCNDCCKGTEPIPLTEEILLKCGFIETKEGYIKALSNNSNIGLIKIKDRFTVSMACPYGLFQSKSIMNLHQLQNLYFALTNQELEINL